MICLDKLNALQGIKLVWTKTPNHLKKLNTRLLIIFSRMYLRRCCRGKTLIKMFGYYTDNWTYVFFYIFIYIFYFFIYSIHPIHNSTFLMNLLTISMSQLEFDPTYKLITFAIAKYIKPKYDYKNTYKIMKIITNYKMF